MSDKCDAWDFDPKNGKNLSPEAPANHDLVKQIEREADNLGHNRGVTADERLHAVLKAAQRDLIAKAAELARLRERCEGYKGQVEAGAARIGELETSLRESCFFHELYKRKATSLEAKAAQSALTAKDAELASLRERNAELERKDADWRRISINQGNELYAQKVCIDSLEARIAEMEAAARGVIPAVVTDGKYPKPKHGWTCFHCGDTFTTPGAARDHFGCEPSADPACKIKVGEERGLVMALRRAEVGKAELEKERDSLLLKIDWLEKERTQALASVEWALSERGISETQEKLSKAVGALEAAEARIASLEETNRQMKRGLLELADAIEQCPNWRDGVSDATKVIQALINARCLAAAESAPRESPTILQTPAEAPAAYAPEAIDVTSYDTAARGPSRGDIETVREFIEGKGVPYVGERQKVLAALDRIEAWGKLRAEDIMTLGVELGKAQSERDRIAEALGKQSFQERVYPWMMECFGAEISADAVERNHRFLEESLELVQALNCPREDAHQLVDYVYDRPIGVPHQEVGGVQVTLAAMCLANALDMHKAGEDELARIWTKVDKIRAKQAAKPKGSPLPQHVLPAQQTQISNEVRDALTEAEKALEPACNFAWTAVNADCEEARLHLNGIITAQRAALAKLRNLAARDGGAAP